MFLFPMNILKSKIQNEADFIYFISQQQQFYLLDKL